MTPRKSVHLRLCCGSLPQWSEHYPISAHHGNSNVHWSTCRLTTTSDKNIKMRTSGMVASVTAMLTWGKHCSSEPTLPMTASTHQASHCSRSFIGQPVLLSLAQASHWGRSFPGQPASPLSLALASRLLRELRPGSHMRQLTITQLSQGRSLVLAQAGQLQRELHLASTNGHFQGQQYHRHH
jgi:hypothetical protein